MTRFHSCTFVSVGQSRYTHAGHLWTRVGRSVLLIMLLLLARLGAQAQKTWTGATTNWNTASNWSPAGIPTASDDVVIPPAPANQPILSSTAVANTVEVQSGASLSITSGGSLTLDGTKTVNGSTATFYNQGTVSNQGQMVLSNPIALGAYGLRNIGNFTNKPGGAITIDRSTLAGFFNDGGTVSNEGQVVIGNAASPGSYGLQNAGNFTNKTGGTITLNRSSLTGLFNSGGSFTNAAQIIIGSALVRNKGLENQAAFFNNAGGAIIIDRVTAFNGSGGNGLINTGGTFTNAAQITIGASQTLDGTGLVNQSTFVNNTGGVIAIDRTGIGFGNYTSGGNFTNSARITIGVIASVGSAALTNQSGATFTNKAGGVITLDRAVIYGLLNENSTFTNEARITIGAIATVGGTALRSGLSFNNSGCGALLNVVDNSVITDTGGGITNSGTIIENANHQSNISANTGIVQNNNGSNFYVGSGPNQPLSISVTNPTNSTSSDGAITLTGLHATTSYALSYTVGGNSTTLSPDPTSNASGQLTIPNLKAGLYAITLGGSCVGLPLSLSATLTPVPDLTPILYARPTTVYGNTPLTVVVDVAELNAVSTSGTITVKITKDAKAPLSFDGSLTTLAGHSIQNSSWSFASESGFYVLTTTQSVAGGDKLSFGLSGLLSSGATSGVLTVSAIVVGESGGEGRITNNADADKVDYFQQ